MMKQNNTSIASRLLMMAMLLLVHLQTTRAEDIYASYTMKEGTTMYIDAKEHSKVKYYTVTMDYYYKISDKGWTVSNSGYISFVDNNTSDYRVGIKAEKPGTVILTFKLDYYWVENGNVYWNSPLKINYKITVVENPPSGITISPSTKNIGVGQTFTASYTLTPSDAVTTVTWSSDNKSIATVSSTGTVKGIKAGSTSINVRTANGYSASCTVNVKDATLVIDRDSTTAFVGDVFKLSSTIEYTDEKSITWSTEDSNVATVNSSTGEVKAVGLGTTNIIASSSGGLTAKSKVNVIEKVLMQGTVASVSAGRIFSLLLKKDHTLWACGNNYYGQLGDGTTTSHNIPANVMNGVKSVSAGGFHSMILKTDGTLWACGYNHYGQLGDGTTTDRSTPVKVMDGVASVSAGYDHSMILKTDGTLWACGRNYDGLLGDGTTTSRSTPVKVMDGVASVSAGGFHSMILKTDGTLWACGYNYYSQLGDGSTVDRHTPAQIADSDADTDISQLDNVIYIKNLEARPGNQIVIPITMKNTAAIRSYQFDLYLPDGVTAAVNSKGRVQASLNRSRLEEDDQHTLGVDVQNDGSIRFLVNSMEEDSYPAGDGDVLSVTVNVAEDMAEGEYTLSLRNMKLSETDISKFYVHNKVNSTLSVIAYTLGDINSDGVVDVSDYTGVANHILGKTPTGFEKRAADVDENGVIDVSDYTGIANIILRGNIYGKSEARSYTPMKSAKVQSTDLTDIDNVIYVNQAIATSSTATLSICMKNSADIRSYQFDLYLPDGITAAVNSKGRIQASLNRTRFEDETDHTLSADTQEDGAVRFLIGSIQGDTYPAGDGEIITLKINIDKNVPAGSYPVIIRKQKLSETDIAYYYETDYVESELIVTVADGINNVSQSDGAETVYNLRGQRLSAPQRGINIVSGKKVVVK